MDQAGVPIGGFTQTHTRLGSMLYAINSTPKSNLNNVKSTSQMMQDPKKMQIIVEVVKRDKSPMNVMGNKVSGNQMFQYKK